MDINESKQALVRKQTAEETSRPPLVATGRKNEVVAATATRRPQTRDVSSRYMSPSRSTPSTPRRYLSPNPTRTTPTNVPKRAQSVERSRPSTPSTPRRPSTPVRESSVDAYLSSRRTASNRLPDGLWPSMRSLSVSLNSDGNSNVPVSKKEKPNTSTFDRTLRPTSNVAHKKPAEPPTVRKPTPERIRIPLQGKNTSDQLENSKPLDDLHSRLIDHHRWPSSIGGKVSSNTTNRSVDLSDKSTKTLSSSVPKTGLSSLRRLPLSDEASKPLQKSTSDVVRNVSLIESGRTGNNVKSVDDNLIQLLRPLKLVSTSQSDKKVGGISPSRSRPTTPLIGSQFLQTPRSRPSSPSKASIPSQSSARGISPSRSRPSTPPSRGVSPSRTRTTGFSSQSSSSISVLSFIADFRKGKRSTSHIDDAHQLRLLYNRHLQWRYVNARAEDVHCIQTEAAEKVLFNVWKATLSLWDSVMRKRINLQQLKLELKLNSIMNDQIAFLDDWALLETDHIIALSGAVEDLEANTLRLPLTGRAKADMDHLKVAICSAVDVMQAMGSTICSLLSRAEGMNRLVFELAVVAAQEKAILDECEALLASAAAKQVEENSLRTHLMQTKQALANDHG